MVRILLLAAVSTLFLNFAPVMAAEEDVTFAWQDGATGGMTAGSGLQGSQNQKTVDSQLSSMITGNQQPMGIGGMGTSSGMPIPGTYIAPANIALQTEHHSPFGGALPATNLDSIVAQSGYSDFAFGDEGTDGPPPYSGAWGVINEGLHNITTGHPSDAIPESEQ
jgi:hypothetical protein